MYWNLGEMHQNECHFLFIAIGLKVKKELRSSLIFGDVRQLMVYKNPKWRRQQWTLRFRLNGQNEVFNFS